MSPFVTLPQGHFHWYTLLPTKLILIQHFNKLLKNLLMDFLPFWKVLQTRQIMSRICRHQWRNFLLSSGNLSRLLYVYQPLYQPTKLKLLWRWLLPGRNRVIWKHFWGIWRMQSSSNNERNTLYEKKNRKATPLMKNRKHCLAKLFLWVFLVNTLFLWQFLWVLLVNTLTHTPAWSPRGQRQDQ